MTESKKGDESNNFTASAAPSSSILSSSINVPSAAQSSFSSSSSSSGPSDTTNDDTELDDWVVIDSQPNSGSGISVPIDKKVYGIALGSDPVSSPSSSSSSSSSNVPSAAQSSSSSSSSNGPSDTSSSSSSSSSSGQSVAQLSSSSSSSRVPIGKKGDESNNFTGSEEELSEIIATVKLYLRPKKEDSSVNNYPENEDSYIAGFFATAPVSDMEFYLKYFLPPELAKYLAEDLAIDRPKDLAGYLHRYLIRRYSSYSIDEQGLRENLPNDDYRDKISDLASNLKIVLANVIYQEKLSGKKGSAKIIWVNTV